MRKILIGVLVAVSIIGLSGTSLLAQSEEPATLSVYNFNINKMDKNWPGWVAYIKDNGLRIPDLIIVQDFQSKAERLDFQQHLETELGGRWFGRGSADGWHAAVVWRAERFENAKSRSWRGYGDPNHGDGKLQCVEGNHGAPALQVRLRDKIAERFVTAVSFKTPPKDAPETCPWMNAKKVSRALNESGWSGGLMFMGTDANSSDWNETKSMWRCWYSGVNGDLGQGCGEQPNLGFSDPIFDLCAGDWAGCIDDTHDTHRNKAHTTGARIDFLFGRTKTGPAVTSNQETLPWGEPEFSDHRSVRAIFEY